ncbi:hypothetical protein FHS77_000424 [Paenochrobactrum gallinarii]|uniref:Uncharacterized protein n=1 Tax=Paenochrobactrum gallinarii TaxID=643673 RepID=A0A841LRQ0_9HYPH|nr:hypothetical protein [Paenochrobactrum gallinarii]
MKTGTVVPVVKGFNHKGFSPFLPVDKFLVKNFMHKRKKQRLAEILLKNQTLAWLTVLRALRFSATELHFQRVP